MSFFIDKKLHKKNITRKKYNQGGWGVLQSEREKKKLPHKEESEQLLPTRVPERKLGGKILKHCQNLEICQMCI